MKKTRQIFIIDFDSTFIQHEGLDVFAQVVLKKHPQKDKIVARIQEITKQGMEGKIPFDISLEKRITLLKGSKEDITTTVRLLKKSVTASIQRNRSFFTSHKDQIYIISGGFKEFILPVVVPYGVAENHIFANTFLFNKKDRITGYDKTNILSKKSGKSKLVASLGLDGEIVIIGDGYTDYQLRKEGHATKFVAFTENTLRESVVVHADSVAPTFDEFLFVNRLPMSVSYPKNRINALLLENIDNEAVKILEKEGYHVIYHEKSLPEEILKKKIEDVHLLGIRSRTEIKNEVLSHAQKLLAIGAFCIGTDQISLDTAGKRGIAVFNAPYSNTRSVVELVLGEIIMLLRGITDKSQSLHQGIWDKSAVGSNEVRGKILGVIGYGNIGSQVSVLAESLGMQVIFYDRVEKLALGNAKRCKTLTELLKKADIATIHVDGRKENYNLFSTKEFALMKPGAIFLNLSRGKIVDVDALAYVLKQKRLRGAAVDVFPSEPKGKDEIFTSVLQGLPNVILTPHIGGSTMEAQHSIADYVSKKLIDYVNTGNTYLNTTLPEIQLTEAQKTHRLLHLHQNVPGILARINGILADHKMNILAQYLKTTEDVGYVITDVNKKYNTLVLSALKEIPETIRFRVLY